MFIRTILCLALIAGMQLTASAGPFTTVYNFDAIRDQLDTLDSNSLVIFDYRSVIGIQADIYDRGFKKERAQGKTIRGIRNLQSVHHKNLSQHEREKLRHIHKKAFSVFILIDPSLPKLIKKLQNRGIKVIVLTHFELSACNKKNNSRYKDLLRYGINLSSSFPDHKNIIFTDIGSNNHTPNFCRGILSNGNSCSKGDLLVTFFQHINWQPKHVIFFDNSSKQLHSVQQALEKINIPFQGFEYLGAQKMPAIFDPVVAAFQLDYLVKHKRWLHSSEAIALIENGAMDID